MQNIKMQDQNQIQAQVNNVINEIDWVRSLSMVNTVGFLSYAIDEYNLTYDDRLLPNEKQALTYSAALLAIAGGHYAILDVNKPSVSSEILIRYSDWLFTTPLLLLVLTSYYQLDEEITYTLVVLNLIMIILGLLYEETQNMLWWYISSASYLSIVYLLYQNLPERDLFYKYFVVGWSLYGIIALKPQSERLIYFTALDLYNKLIFAFDVRSKIMSDMKKRQNMT